MNWRSGNLARSRLLAQCHCINSGAGPWPAAASQAANAVTPRWINRLGGADVYTLANAYSLVESLRIDYGHLGAFGIHP